MNTAILQIIDKGLDASKELMKYANSIQDGIDELNKDTIKDFDEDIQNIQKQYDILLERTKTKANDLSLEELSELYDKMGEISEKIRKIKKEKLAYKEKENAKKNEKLRAVGTFAAEFVSGVAPFTVTYRAIKKRNNRKKSFSTSKDDSAEHNV